MTVKWTRLLTSANGSFSPVTGFEVLRRSCSSISSVSSRSVPGRRSDELGSGAGFGAGVFA